MHQGFAPSCKGANHRLVFVTSSAASKAILGCGPCHTIFLCMISWQCAGAVINYLYVVIFESITFNLQQKKCRQ